MSDAPAGLQNSAAVGVGYAAPGDEPPARTAKSSVAHVTYDPTNHTVEEVQAYLAKHPDQRDAVVAAEKAGKNRVTLTETQEAQP